MEVRIAGHGVTAMPKPKGFRVIAGGKPAEPPSAEAMSAEVSQLLDRVRRYRDLLPKPLSDETRGLLADFEDAVEALRRLEHSVDAMTQPRVAEYRHLIAELDAEIVAVWRAAAPEK